MAASDHVSQAQSGKYEFRRNTDYDATYYRIYKGDMHVGSMDISHLDDDAYDEHEGSPYVNKVSLLHMAKGHAAAGMTALGIAQNRAAEYGSKLSPDASLSHYSSRVVRNAQNRGLVTEDRPNEVTNTMTHMIPKPANPYRLGHPLNTEEVSAGRQTIRQTLKRGRPKK